MEAFVNFCATAWSYAITKFGTGAVTGFVIGLVIGLIL